MTAQNTGASVPLLEFTGEPAAIQRRARPRVKTAGFPAMPIELDEFYAADLTTVQRGVFISLKAHLWFHGSLPITAKGLADIGRVHVRTWARMEATLAPHFDIDESGRWRHYDLEEARSLKIEISEKRRSAGRRGAAAVHGDRADSYEIAPEDAPDYVANGLANALANGLANATGKTDVPDQSALAPALATPSRTYGLSDGLDSQSFQEDIEESDGRTGARAQGDAAGKEAAKSYASGDLAMPSAGTSAIAHVVANATPDAGQSAPAPSDQSVIEALRKAGGDKIPPMLLTVSGIAPIRALLEMGCDLARDVVPAVETGVRGLREPLRSLRAKFLTEMAMANRDQALKTQSVPAFASTKYFAETDSPEWRAWLAATGKKSFPQTEGKNTGGRKGWYFDSQWPPGIDPSLYEQRRPAAKIA